MVPVLQGPLRGMRWIVGAQLHGMWLGSFEAETQQAISRTLRPGQTFYDIGANVGFYTLLGARCVGASGRVVAVEPLPRNIDILRKHLRLNAISNAQIVEKAVSNRCGAARFVEDGTATSKLGEEGCLDVAVTTLDRLVEETGFPPHVMKVDIEGAELEFIDGARHVLSACRPIVFLSAHSERIFTDMVRIMRGHSYAARAQDGGEVKESEFQQETIFMPLESLRSVEFPWRKGNG